MQRQNFCTILLLFLIQLNVFATAKNEMVVLSNSVSQYNVYKQLYILEDKFDINVIDKNNIIDILSKKDQYYNIDLIYDGLLCKLELNIPFIYINIIDLLSIIFICLICPINLMI